MRKGPTPFNIAAITVGLVFLYLPIAALVLYSFNASRLVTVWGGFSTRWYESLFANEALMGAAWVTVRVGLISATAATVLGTLAAVALARGGRFGGRTLFSGLVYAPMVMPEVILGLSLLLLFVALRIDRGFWTVVIAHSTCTLAYVAVVVHARLVTFDRALEEAAQDLGCPPIRTFLTVTLPNIAPAVAAGWVVASFASGPGATTLPMRIYSQVRLGVSPEINAACTLLIAAVATALLIYAMVGKWRRVKELRSEAGAIERAAA
jgi:putrescine transport system permease protein